MEEENNQGSTSTAGFHMHEHTCAHSLTCATHVHVHTHNQTDPPFLPTKAVADLLFKTNELGSWAIEFNGTQLS